MRRDSWKPHENISKKDLTTLEKILSEFPDSTIRRESLQGNLLVANLDMGDVFLFPEREGLSMTVIPPSKAYNVLSDRTGTYFDFRDTSYTILYDPPKED